MMHSQKKRSTSRKTRSYHMKKVGKRKNSQKKRKSSKKRKMSKKRKSPFTKKDFKSKDGMLTYIWGPSLWHTLHTISFNYPNNPTCKQKNQYKQFFLSLQNVLPCGACRNNLNSNLTICPLRPCDLKNRKSLSYWLFRLHNTVNKMLDKPCELSYREVRDRYESFRARCSLSNTHKELLEIQKKMKRSRKSKSGKSKSGKSKSWKNNGKTEDGCVTPLTGVKSKCVLKIVPKDCPCKSLDIDPRCCIK